MTVADLILNNDDDDTVAAAADNNNAIIIVANTAASSSETTTTTTTMAESSQTGKKDPEELQQVLLPPTDMLYYTYNGNSLTTCHARVLSIQEKTMPAGSHDTKINDGINSDVNNDNATSIVVVDVCLDQTILHAQGGGQPTDFGRLQLLVHHQHHGNDDNDDNEDFGPEDDDLSGQEGIVTVMHVDKVLLDRATGVATHTGRLMVVGNNTNTNSATTPAASVMMLRVGDVVKVAVDKERRQILSECHTAGHVVDAAMAQCGKVLKPSKGYHFLDGPYVEYQGSIAANEKDALLKDLQEAYCQLVHQDIETKIELLSKEDAVRICNRLMPNYFNVNAFCNAQTQKVRVVTVAGYPCPCGGTHVARTGDLKERQWNITGIKSKKNGLVRVKYGPTITVSDDKS